jgi:hypothetical protein
MLNIKKLLALYYQDFKHLQAIYRTRHKDKITVVFYAMNVSSWNYQHLYERMKLNLRFDIYVVLYPSPRLPVELRNEDARALRDYFDERSVHYIDCNEKGEIGIDVTESINPDILFFSQPYLNTMTPREGNSHLDEKLCCYYPYAFWTANGVWSYNLPLHYFAWKLFYSTPLHLEDAKRYCENKGRNVVVTGYPKADDFLAGNFHDVWKVKDRRLKRLIWAPHFTLKPSMKGTVARSNFLMMADLMVNVAKKYADRMQIAFKPHPRLKSELYLHEDWGKERTEEYYKLWDSMDNTFLADGEYIDLFMTSDAMIHDSSSFSVEYHYSHNPVMFISQDINAYKEMLNDFGKLTIDMHYIGKTKEDILSFIEEKVLQDIDPMQEQRERFFYKYLVPSHKSSVAEYTYNDIVTSLGIN